MVFHATALAETGVEVDLVGFAAPAWRPPNAPPNLRVLSIDPLDDGTRLLGPYLARAFVRAACHSWAMWRLLFTVPPFDVILIQNPPGVPALAIAWLAARVRGARMGIDWHNL